MQSGWHKAAAAGDVGSMERLLSEGAEINKLDRYGQTALMQASLHGRDEVVRVLLENNADTDVTAKYGLSALMLAAINGRAGVGRQLVDAGAATALRGSGAPGFAGKTARQLAESGGFADLAATIANAEREESPGN